MPTLACSGALVWLQALRPRSAIAQIKILISISFLIQADNSLPDLNASRLATLASDRPVVV